LKSLSPASARPARKLTLASVDATVRTFANAFLASANLLAFRASIPARYSAAASNSGALMLGEDGMLPPMLSARTGALVVRRTTNEAVSAARVAMVVCIGYPL